MRTEAKDKAITMLLSRFRMLLFEEAARNHTGNIFVVVSFTQGLPKVLSVHDKKKEIKIS